MTPPKDCTAICR